MGYGERGNAPAVSAGISIAQMERKVKSEKEKMGQLTVEKELHAYEEICVD